MEPPPKLDYGSLVDTSRPFRSVKEAVEVFGERILVGEIYSPKPYFTPTPSHEIKFGTPSSFSSLSPIYPRKGYEIEHEHEHEQNNNKSEFFGTLKKIESELEETKQELKMLKERESETEIAVASLNAELHKNMSKLAEAEAKKAGDIVRKASFRKEEVKEDKKKEVVIRVESPNSARLAQILSIGDEKGYFGRVKEKKKMKKKPIIPLIGNILFFRRKGSGNKSTLDNPLYASSHGVF